MTMLASEPRFDRRTLVALASGIVAAAIEARTAWAAPLRGPAGSWALPPHDLAATRDGGQIGGTRVRWRAEVAGGVAGAPSIVDGSVFAASVGGVVASFDLGTGHARWQRRFPTAAYGSGKNARRLGFFGGVAVADGRVLAASDRVICLDDRSGRTLWEASPLRQRLDRFAQVVQRTKGAR